jgi:hypothetical protein
LRQAGSECDFHQRLQWCYSIFPRHSL